jgi:hypothetical protein
MLNLFNDQEAGAAFAAKPAETLEAAGFKGLCSDDVYAIMPVILDKSPISIDRDYESGNNSAWGGDVAGGGGSGGGGGGGGWGGGGGGGGWGGGGDDHAAAVQALTSVFNTYNNYVDDRDINTFTDNTSVINGHGNLVLQKNEVEVTANTGDQSQVAAYGGENKAEDSFNNGDKTVNIDSHDQDNDLIVKDNVVASDHAVAAGDDIKDNEVDVEIGNTEVKVEDSFTVEDSGNTEYEDNVLAENYNDGGNQQNDVVNVLAENEQEIED